MRFDMVDWVSVHVLPHEAAVRSWLRRSSFRNVAEDDTIQEAYCRIAGITDATHIRSGRAYFFTVVRNILLEKLRHERVIRIDAMAEIDELSIVDSEPSAERFYAGRQLLEMIRGLLEEMPPICRQVFLLRRIEELSQRDVAQRLGISENVVEKQLAGALRFVLKRISGQEDSRAVRPVRAEGQREPSGRKRNQRRD